MRLRWMIAAPTAVLWVGFCCAQVGVGTSDAAGERPDIANLDLRVTAADIEPSVTIEQFDNRTVEEYSVNNNVYMVKITPAAGAPYYLVDEDGSGELAWRRGPQAADNKVPQWTLLSW